MNGYFIPTAKAIELEFLDNPNIKKDLQKIIIAITDKDVEEYKDTFEINEFNLTEEKSEEYANWFYKNYFSSIMESILK
jgi:hypothetical protein